MERGTHLGELRRRIRIYLVWRRERRLCSDTLEEVSNISSKDDERVRRATDDSEDRRRQTDRLLPTGHELRTRGHRAIPVGTRTTRADDWLVIGGDRNATIGRKEQEKFVDGTCGPFGLGKLNEAGRDLQWCHNNGLAWCDAFHKFDRRGTWQNQ